MSIMLTKNRTISKETSEFLTELIVCYLINNDRLIQRYTDKELISYLHRLIEIDLYYLKHNRDNVFALLWEAVRSYKS